MNRMLKSKKAQFFIFTALILIGFSTLMLQSNNVVPSPSKTFGVVYDNFVFESNKAVNNAVFEGKDVGEEYGRFLTRFIGYAKMKKLQLEIFAVVAQGDRIYYMNRMEVPVDIFTIDQTIAPGTGTYFARNTTELTIKVPDDVFHENIYKLTFPEQETEVKAVLRVRKGSDREIFVKE